MVLLYKQQIYHPSHLPTSFDFIGHSITDCVIKLFTTTLWQTTPDNNKCKENVLDISVSKVDLSHCWSFDI